MYKNVGVVVPALNEAGNIAGVVGELKKVGLEKIVVGVDSITNDGTEAVLDQLGVKWVKGLKSGYDGTVRAGVEGVKKWYKEVQFILFADAGGKYDFEVVRSMIGKAKEGAGMVLGVRIEEKQHMLWHQKLGTQLVLWPMNLIYGQGILDISPFRLVSRDVLGGLDMKEGRFSWPSQMLVKALARGVNIAQVPVTLRPRLGKSKVSGSIINSLRAGGEMIGSLRYAISGVA